MAWGGKLLYITFLAKCCLIISNWFFTTAVVESVTKIKSQLCMCCTLLTFLFHIFSAFNN